MVVVRSAERETCVEVAEFWRKMRKRGLRRSLWTGDEVAACWLVPGGP